MSFSGNQIYSSMKREMVGTIRGSSENTSNLGFDSKNLALVTHASHGLPVCNSKSEYGFAISSAGDELKNSINVKFPIPLNIPIQNRVFPPNLSIKNKSFKCEYCEMCFISEMLLKQHDCCSGNSQLVACKEFAEQVSDSGDLSSHLNMNFGKESLAPEELKQKFSGINNYASRRHKCSRRGHFECNECGKVYTRKRSLDIHYRIHSGEKPFACDKCEESFRSKDFLKKHYLTHTLEMQTTFKKEKLFPQKSILSKNQTQYRDPKPEYNFCISSAKDGFKNIKNLKFPMQLNIHNKKGIDPKSPNPSIESKLYKCKSCEMFFISEMVLKQHNCHNNISKLAIDEEFAERISDSGDLNSHLCTDSTKESLILEECGPELSGIKNQESHHRTLSENECCECGKVFSSKRSLDIHYRIHSGEKPFACDKCKESFSRKDYLKKHYLTHLLRKSYTCKKDNLFPRKSIFSGKKFSNQFRSNLHLPIFSDGRTFSCKECLKEFSFQWELERHLENRSGYQPFVCVLCGVQYSGKCNLKAHLRIVHAITQSDN